MQLSVVILNYNVRYFLEQCVLSVQKAIQNLDAEIIVIDNNSPDDSVAMMTQRFPDVKLIANTENLGFPKGNNIGVARAKGDYICILNPDTVVAEDTFEKVLSFAQTKPDLGIVGVKLIDGTGKFLPESKRGIPTPRTALGKITGFSKGKYYAAHLGENETGKVEILVGAFMVMKRELYHQVGGFDENCFMYSDDIDLSYTVLKSGKSNYYFGDTSVIHYKGESTVKDAQYMKRFQEAMDFFYKKHFRKSFVFDLFMKIGAYFFALKKAKVSGKTTREYAHALISEDDDLPFDIRPSLPGHYQFFTLESVKQARGFKVLFDAELLSFKQIIDAMERMSELRMVFRIVHKNDGYLIGSDSSNDRGEVVTFATRRE